jgi:heparan-alpha-glucosaminide N-acetyltransferase
MTYADLASDETVLSDRSLAASLQARVASVDALRGLVIFLMIFVNDVAGVQRAPFWLKHVGVDADAMTLPDIVFPSFLFIAGMSIPLSLHHAWDGGRIRARLLVKVLMRTLALLVMGVLMVNGESYNPWYRGLCRASPDAGARHSSSDERWA